MTVSVRRRGRRVLPPLALALALLGVWQLYVESGSVDALILPSPTDVASALYNDRGLLWDALGPTALEVLAGIAIAVAIGMVLAVAIHLSSTLRRAVHPLVLASQTVPIPVVAPLLIFWLGFGLAPKLVIVALICFFPVVLNTLDGLADVDPGLLKVMHTLDASRWATLRRVELPSALPGVFSGAKIAIVVAVIGAVLAEQAASEQGLGHLIQLSTAELDSARSYAAMVVLSAFAILLFGTLTLLERQLLPWAHRTRRGDPR
ncbi:MAG: ABC transporter permease [Solirubrobacterales bacterium]|nr:MAG: ABC transporter permease [Solirubrobacterales bacterium]